MAKKGRNYRNWVPIVGKWNFEENSAIYVSPEPNIDFPHGITLCPQHIRNGEIQTSIIFPEEPEKHEAKIIFGFDPKTNNYYSAGIGGYGLAFGIDEFISGRGWHAIYVEGSKSNILENNFYNTIVKINGNLVSLIINDIKIIEINLPHPLYNDQVGLFAAGPKSVKFQNLIVLDKPIKIFVIMEYSEPFNTLYTEVIRPVCSEMKLDAYRADDIQKPGMILQDIITSIVESEIIIADITSANPNVFYELGYAHAINKTTILLAERESPLPFDVKNYRVIFYDNTIRGKDNVENQLRKHLSNILGNSEN